MSRRFLQTTSVVKILLFFHGYVVCLYKYNIETDAKVLPQYFKVQLLEILLKLSHLNRRMLLIVFTQGSDWYCWTISVSVFPDEK